MDIEVVLQVVLYWPEALRMQASQGRYSLSATVYANSAQHIVLLILFLLVIFFILPASAEAELAYCIIYN